MNLVYGYNIIDSFAVAARKAGANLTTDTFIKAMDTMVIEPDMFGASQITSRRRSGWAARSRACRSCKTGGGR